MDDKQRVRQAADIYDVVSSVTPLKHQRGPWYQGLCPFHGEKTPSFRINREEGFFKCFGCGEKGDVFSFIQKRENVGFREAMHILADRFGVTLTEVDAATTDSLRRMREATAEAQTFYRRCFESSEDGAPARDYAKLRRLSSPILERFGIGAAPASRDALFRYLTSRGYEVETLESAGLVRSSMHGGFHDVFRNRLMFPICNEMGSPLAFGARALDPAERAKYINSQETPIYQKGDHVYALHLAKDAIRQADRVLVVEGYMDVIALHQAGIREAVAVLGTAMTQQQARNLLRFTPGKRVLVSFDADAAGREAAGRGIDTLEEVARAVGLHLSVLTMPDAKDPDEFIQNQGADAFRSLMAHGQDVVGFQVERILSRIPDLGTSAANHRALAELAPVFRRLDSPARAEPYFKTIAFRLGLSEYSVSLEFNKHLRHNVAPRAGTRPVAVAQQREAEAERGLIHLMVEDTEIRRVIAESLDSVPFPTPNGQRLRERLVSDLAHLKSWPALVEALEGSPEQSLVLDVRFEDFGNKVSNDRVRTVDNYIDVIAQGFWKKIATSRQEELSRPDLSPEEVQRVTQDMIDAQRRATEHQKRLSGREQTRGQI